MKRHSLQVRILQVVCMAWLVVFYAGTAFSADAPAASDPKAAAAPQPAAEPKAADQPTAVEKININTATAEELARLNGIGPKYAQDIITHRTTYGPFEKPEDIMNVKGIGQKIFERNKDRISI